jgi:hypothetical protein
MSTLQPNQPPTLTPEQVVEQIRFIFAEKGEFKSLANREAAQLLTDYVAQVTTEKETAFSAASKVIAWTKCEEERDALRTICAKQKEAINNLLEVYSNYHPSIPDTSIDLDVAKKEASEALALTPATVADELAALQKKLAATVKAKRENDERFMIERDEARSELAAKDKRIAELEAWHKDKEIATITPRPQLG